MSLSPFPFLSLFLSLSLSRPLRLYPSIYLTRFTRDIPCLWISDVCGQLRMHAVHSKTRLGARSIRCAFTGAAGQNGWSKRVVNTGGGTLSKGAASPFFLRGSHGVKMRRDEMKERGREGEEGRDSADVGLRARTPARFCRCVGALLSPVRVCVVGASRGRGERLLARRRPRRHADDLAVMPQWTE
jgi:hypothetical protein